MPRSSPQPDPVRSPVPDGAARDPGSAPAAVSAGARRRCRRRLRRWAVAAAGLVAGLAAAGWWLLPWALPLPADLGQPHRASLQWLDRDGRPLRLPLTDEVRRGLPVGPDSIPERVRLTTLIAEDRRFDHHGGIDLRATARAGRDAIRHGRVTSGASTISQQLVKLASPPAQRTPATKLREMLQARRLEMTRNKPDILAAYLNRLPYGNLMEGIDAASHGYFNKPPADLSWAEAALLAGLPQAPTRLNPWRDPQPAQARQRHILHQLHRHGWIDRATLDRALAEPLDLEPRRAGFAAPHAVDWLEQQHRAGAVGSGSLRTTIDRELQTRVEELVARTLAPLADRHVGQAAVVVIDNHHRQVLALAGSIDYHAAEGQLNGAWLSHPAGSALKPFTYALALERGLSPATIVPDLPVRFVTAEGVYQPENYHRRHHGPVTHAFALANSLNIPAVRVLDQVGGPDPLLTLLQQLGLGSLTEPAEHYGLGLTLGNGPVRLIELTNAYATLANLGRHQPWTLLAEAHPPEPDLHPADGASAAADRERATRPLHADTAYTIAAILSDPLARSPAFGTRSHLDLPFRAAVKTGTSTDYRDNWALGFTRDHTVGVWVGNFDRQPMRGVSGVTGAAPLLQAVFLALAEHRPPAWLPRPESVVDLVIDPRTGRRIDPQGPLRPLMTMRLTCPSRSLPPPADAGDYDAQGRAWVDAAYSDWIAGAENWLGQTVRPGPPPVAGNAVAAAADQPPPSSPRPQILEPAEGAVLLLDPDLPGGGRRLLLRHSGDAQAAARWHSDTLAIRPPSPNRPAEAELVPGRHQIQLLDDQGQLLDRAWLEVRDR